LFSLPSCSAPRLTVKLNPRDENDINANTDDDNDDDDDYDHDNEQSPSSEADNNSSNFSPTFHKEPL
jgi:hypothetical protein